MSQLISSSTNPVPVHGYLLVNPSKGTYKGLDREPWECVGDLFYKNALPGDLGKLFKETMRSPDTHFWGPLASSLDPCLRFQKFIRRPILEILAVHSPYLESVGHSIVVEQSANFLGFDVRPVGDSSLLYELENKITRMPTVLSELLNEAGLLQKESDVSLVADLYKKLADLDVVEPIEPWESIAADQPCPLEAVAVYAIDTDG